MKIQIRFSGWESIQANFMSQQIQFRFKDTQAEARTKPHKLCDGIISFSNCVHTQWAPICVSGGSYSTSLARHCLCAPLMRNFYLLVFVVMSSIAEKKGTGKRLWRMPNWWNFLSNSMKEKVYWFVFLSPCMLNSKPPSRNHKIVSYLSSMTISIRFRFECGEGMFFDFDNNEQWIKFVRETTRGITSILWRWLRCEHRKTRAHIQQFFLIVRCLVAFIRQLLCLIHHPLAAFHSRTCSSWELLLLPKDINFIGKLQLKSSAQKKERKFTSLCTWRLFLLLLFAFILRAWW